MAGGGRRCEAASLPGVACTYMVLTRPVAPCQVVAATPYTAQGGELNSGPFPLLHYTLNSLLEHIFPPNALHFRLYGVREQNLPLSAAGFVILGNILAPSCSIQTHVLYSSLE